MMCRKACGTVKAKATIVMESILNCPNCGFTKQETMPSDACQFFYECTQCHTVLKPKPGDCCTFCSYGSVECPSRKVRSGCC